MANMLGKDTQAVVIGALAEASSIRSIERMTGVHRDTIMRLGVKVGPLRCTPAMEAGIERDFWGVRYLLEAAA